MSDLTHLDRRGEARMVDVGSKDVTVRRATASGRILMQSKTLSLIEGGGHHKGDVLAVARVAGIMAAKRTSELVPLCHPLAIDSVEVCLAVVAEQACVSCQATVSSTGKTGVEMEALTAVEIALLTVYDMCKSVDRGMTITDIALVSKSGGRSGDWQRNPAS
ncbi:MAG: cyclic pyranopterin monophosphate synthase MoaC [Acidiferrobacteraceae bacterium]|jgi:cyclic pyranopterin phosphate synthase